MVWVVLKTPCKYEVGIHELEQNQFININIFKIPNPICSYPWVFLSLGLNNKLSRLKAKPMLIAIITAFFQYFYQARSWNGKWRSINPFHDFFEQRNESIDTGMDWIKGQGQLRTKKVLCVNQIKKITCVCLLSELSTSAIILQIISNLWWDIGTWT